MHRITVCLCCFGWTLLTQRGLKHRACTCWKNVFVNQKLIFFGELNVTFRGSNTQNNVSLPLGHCNRIMFQLVKSEQSLCSSLVSSLQSSIIIWRIMLCLMKNTWLFPIWEFTWSLFKSGKWEGDQQRHLNISNTDCMKDGETACSALSTLFLWKGPIIPNWTSWRLKTSSWAMFVDWHVYWGDQSLDCWVIFQSVSIQLVFFWTVVLSLCWPMETVQSVLHFARIHFWKQEAKKAAVMLLHVLPGWSQFLSWKVVFLCFHMLSIHV